MNNNAIAKKMAAFGQREAAAMRQLAKVQQDRCEFLSGLVPDAGLDDETVAASVAPKDGGGQN